MRQLAVSVTVLLVCALPYACGPSRHVTTPTSHRAVAPPACPSQPITSYVCSDPGGTAQCTTSSDCTAGLDGSCLDIHGGCTCTYDACLTDDDCGPGTTCTCKGNYVGGAGYSGTQSTTKCVPSNCRVDSDCGPGGFCSPSLTGSCGTDGGFYCHTAHDECGNDSDCVTSACVYSPEVSHWICSPSQGGCGGG